LAVDPRQVLLRGAAALVPSRVTRGPAMTPIEAMLSSQTGRQDRSIRKTPIETMLQSGPPPSSGSKLEARSSQLKAQLGFLPLLIIPIKAGIKFLRTPKGRELIAKIRSKRQAAIAAQNAAAPGTAASIAAAAELERLAALENQARAGKVSESDVAVLLPALAKGVVPVAAPVAAVVEEPEEGEDRREQEPEGDKGGDEEESLGRFRSIPVGQRRSPIDKEQIDRYLANGTGGLGFRASSPAGSGRLCRMQFYPTQPKDAVSAVFSTVLGFRILIASGIDEPGDDPIINLAIQGLNAAFPLPPSFLSPLIPLAVPQIDYGVYRVLGLQTHEWGVSFEASLGLTALNGTLTTQPVVTVSALQTQNGRKLLVTDTQGLPASTFAILPYNGDLGSISGALVAPVKASIWQQRRSRFFSGLRDNPVIEQTNAVTMFAQAMVDAIPDMSFPNRMVIPFAANLVVEMLEDDVYGNPIVPSASARAGAQTKLSLRPIGRDRENRSEILVTSPRYIPPRT
jgi:hypothetical protein